VIDSNHNQSVVPRPIASDCRSYAALPRFSGQCYIPLMRAGSVVPFVNYLQGLRSPADRLPEQLGFTDRTLDNPESLVPIRRVWELLGVAAQLEGLNNIGLLVGSTTAIEELGAYGKAILASSNLYEAINIASSLLPTQNSGAEMWMEIQAGVGRLCHRHIADLQFGRQQADHLALTFLIQLLREGAGSTWNPPTVHLETGECHDFTASGLPANTAIRFNQPETSVTFPASLMNRTLPGQNRRACPTLQREVERLTGSAPATTFIASVEQLIEHLLTSGSPGISRAAEAAGMSVRTFQRRLAEAGLSYSTAVAKVRLATAERLLRNRELTLQEIGRRLGYSDHASFTHAFRHWSGVVPRDYRRGIRRD